MATRFTYCFGIVLSIFNLVLLSSSFSQSITTGALSTSSICAGTTISVPYSTSGSFGVTNQFSVQLSDAAGTFAATSAIIGGPVTSTALAGSISATIPASAAAGSGYRVRITASAPATVGSLSPTILTITAIPAAPQVAAIEFCQNTPPPSLTASVTATAGAILKWYPSNTSGTGTTIAPTPSTAVANTNVYYVSQTVNGCESPRAALFVTVKPTPAAPGVSPVNLCLNEPTQQLTATAASGAALNWYGTNATGGTASATAPTPSAGTAGTTNYYVSQTLNGCESPRAIIAVTINPLPASPTPMTSATYCQGASAGTFSATPSSGGTLNWYGTNATGGTAVSVAPVIATGTAGTFTYYVSQTVNGCEGPRASITITILPAPAAPNTTPAELCQNTAPPSLTSLVTTISGATLKWYTSGTGGSGSTTTPVPPTTTAAVINYYVSQTVNGCESPRALLTITVKPTPAAPGTSPIALCQNSQGGALTATPSAGATLIWYGTSQTGGNPSTAAPTPPTTTTGVTTYYVSQVLNGCEGNRAALTVTINPVPAVPATPVLSLTYCQNVTATALTATAGTGGTLNWYGTDATGGVASGNANTPSTTTPGVFNYYVSQTVNGCESTRASIAVTIKPTPTAPGTTALAFCQNTPAPALPFSVSPVGGATLNWYGTNSTGGTASTTAPVPGNTTPGSVTYYVSQSLNGCEGPRAALRVQLNSTPGQPTTNPVSYCNNAPAQPLSATGSNLKWYDAAGTLLGSNITPSTGTVGNQTYQVTQTSGEGCESPKASLVVTIKALPPSPGINALNYCKPQQDQPAQSVGPLTASGQNLRWFNSDGNEFPSAPTPFIEQTGIYNYQVTQTVDGCQSNKATLTVNVQTTPAPTIPNPLVTYCRNDNATPLVANGSNMRWIDPYGNVTPNAPTPYTLNSTKPGGEIFYVYQIGANGCYSPRASITLLIYPTPTLSIIGNPTVNLGLPATLQLRFTSVPPFSYTLSDGTKGTTSDTIQNISVTPAQTTIYQVAAVSNACGNGLPGNPATATVTVKIPTITTGAVGNITSSSVCVGTTINVPFTTTGEFNPGNVFRIQIADTISKKFVDIATVAGGSPLTATLPTTLTGGPYFVRVIGTNPSIAVLGKNSPTILTVLPLPTATLTGTQDIYEGGTAKLNVALVGSGPWTFSYTDNKTVQTVTTNANPHTLEVKPLTTTTYQLSAVSNNCGTGSVSGTVTVKVLPLLGVEEDAFSAGIRVFPVPTQAEVTVEFAAPLQKEPAILRLTNQSGRATLLRTTLERRTTLDISQLPAGLYLLNIQVGERHTVRKVLKQ